MVSRRTLWTFIALFAVAAVAVAAPPPPASLGGIDLVILIDQSGSMWGNPKVHPGKNDQWQHRIGATKQIILRLMQHVTNTGIVHQVSVVDFADEARVALSAQTIRFDAANPAELDRLRAVLETAVTAKDWGNTNTAAALQMGHGEIDKMRRSDPPGPRRHILLLITDGKPTVPGVENSQLRTRINDESRRLSSEGVEFWVVGLNDADDYWNSGEGTFWEALTGIGRARLAETASASLPSIFQNIVDDWLGLQSVMVRGDQYDCPPYLRRIVFGVTFGRPRGDIRIVDPDGHPLPMTAGGPPVSPGTFALFALDDPKAGTYTIVRDPTRPQTVYVEEFSPAIERLEPRGQADAGVESRLIFIARDAKGHVVKPLRDYPINASISITDSKGNHSDLPARGEPDGRFSAVWKPGATGKYRVVLRGIIRRRDGSDYDVFANAANSYSQVLEVGNRKPYSLRLMEPDPVKGLRMAPWKRQSDLRFALVDAGGAPVGKLETMVAEPDTWLSIQSLDGSNAALGPIVPLQRDRSGQLAATLPVRVSWLDGEGLLRPGGLRFRIYAKPDHILGERYLRSVDLPPGLEDRRLGDDPLSAGPIDVRLPIWLLACLIVAAVACAALIALAVLGRWLPTVMIRRRDRAARRRLVLKVYDEVRDPAGSAAQEFEVTGKRATDCNVSVDAGGTFVTSTRFRFVRDVGDRRPRGSLSYRWSDSKKTYDTRMSVGVSKTLDGLAAVNYLVLLVELLDQ